MLRRSDVATHPARPTRPALPARPTSSRTVADVGVGAEAKGDDHGAVDFVDAIAELVRGHGIDLRVYALHVVEKGLEDVKVLERLRRRCGLIHRV